MLKFRASFLTFVRTARFDNGSWSRGPSASSASSIGPGRVKIAWKARTVGRDGAFCAAELSIPRDRPPGRHKVTQRLPGMVD